MFDNYKLKPNYVRLRISPETVFALGMMSISTEDENVSECLESIASRHPCPTEMDAYERLLGDAMAGDATHFAREDYVEEAWRIVDPVLKAATPVAEYEPETWGPADVDSRVCPPGGWVNPVIATSPNSEN
jgi:glucose-6-phosphate 1-dehydrogenase